MKKECECCGKRGEWYPQGQFDALCPGCGDEPVTAIKPVLPHPIAEALCIKAEKLGLDHPTESMISDCLLDVICNVLNAPVETAKAIPGNQDSEAMRMYHQNTKLVALAKRIAALNPKCPEIGAGMLASLIEDANRAIDKAEPK